MRDDPIIYEDWLVGYSQFFNYKNTKLANLGLSIAFSLLNFYIGFRFKIPLMVFTWLFALLILVIIEGLAAQITGSIWDQSLIMISIFVLYFITTPQIVLTSDSPDLVSLNFVSGLILTGKLIMIPISISTINFADNTLVPKSDDVRMKLQEQIDRLESTNYRIETKTEFDKSMNKFRLKILVPYSITIAISYPLTLMLYSDNVLTQELASYAISILLLISGLLTSIILTIWLLEKRRLGKGIVVERESGISDFNQENQQQFQGKLRI